MSDLDCERCGKGLDWRLNHYGLEVSICKSCEPHRYKFDTAPPDEVERYKHLFRQPQELKGRDFMGVFRCPNCENAGKSLKQVTRKTNDCGVCGFSYSIYD